MSKPELLKFALERRIKSLGITRKLDGGKALACWEEAVGQKLASRATAESFTDGVLTVVVPDAAWRQEISLSRQDIIERLNEILGSRLVKDLFLVAMPRRKGR